MTPFDTGIYIIINRKYRNVAKLCNANDRSSVVADNQQDDLGEMWNIDFLSNGTYVIQNFGHASSFATAESGFWAKEKGSVVAGTHPYQWKINEMPDKGVYCICLVKNPDICWGLLDSGSDEPIILSHPPTAPQNQWTFIRVEESRGPDGQNMTSGRYFVKNYKYKNIAKLRDANDRSSVVSDNREGDPGEMWNIRLLSNGTYKIQNYGHSSSFATAENGFWAKEKDSVITGTHLYQWKINVMPEKGVYSICPGSNPDICWGLLDSEPNAPIILSHPPTAPQNQWTFVRIEESRRPDDEKRSREELSALEGERLEVKEKERLAGEAKLDAKALEKRQAELERSQDEAKQREMHVRLATIVKDRGGDDYRKLLALRGDIAQAMLNHLQAALDSLEIDNSQKGPLMKALIMLSKKSGLYPECLILGHAANRHGDPIARGSFGDIWRGQISGREVAIKVLRVYQRSDAQKLLKEFCREVTVWRQLSHPNVLPFYGVYHSKGDCSDLCILSPWMEEGNLREYLKRMVKADRVALMLDVAQGLEYLHNMNPSIVHADLKGDNVLITLSHRACIADFGLSGPLESVESRAVLSSLSTGGPKGTAGYQAPELFDPDEKCQVFSTPASDIYAFACVCYETFSGHRPFHNFTDVQMIMLVIRGQRPAHPSAEVCGRTGLKDGVWNLIKSCWEQQPDRRPIASNVVELLRSMRSVESEQQPSVWDDSFILQLRSTLRRPGGGKTVVQLGAQEDSNRLWTFMGTTRTAQYGRGKHQQQLRRDNEAAPRALEEERREAEKKKIAKEQRHVELEAKELEEQLAEEKRKAEERRKAEAEETRRAEIERKQRENEAALRALEVERREAEEKNRLAEERRQAELKANELERRQAEERRKAEAETRRIEIERKRKEDEAALRVLEVERREAKETNRLAEEQRQVELKAKELEERLVEERRQAEGRSSLKLELSCRSLYILVQACTS